MNVIFIENKKKSSQTQSVKLHVTNHYKVPKIPEAGCPLHTSIKKETCCCKNDCCWNECASTIPPEDCLNNVSALWEFDLEKDVWVAQRK